MKWVKPDKGQISFPETPPFDRDEHERCVESDDFNAPLAEQRPSDDGGALATENLSDSETADVVEAERRLADPDDKIIPFRPSR